jgi:ASC-1-like (ASCH) protein
MDYFEKYLKYKTKYLEFKSTQKNLEGGGKKLKKNNYNKINSNNYTQISRMNLEPKYKETLSEPWFTLISLGLKTVEGRKNKGRFKEMVVGDIVEWSNDDFKPRSVITRITRKAEYSTFEEYLETEGLQKCLPGMPDIDTGLSVYFKYFTKQDEKEFGVVAIEIELVK